ncbi:hypothetical protein [Pseudothermotoga thermarum]|uniref:Uncharacterized protein n=1 Tax=Pseudothermotoga thermarum DSM 5069 TaxID=688269 RepID=F7YWN1_9THEM|nr:hypothetical protein [Pseudothermotoga thermarum]AEH52018.1 hypothetical protein Theth_1978 [Pseudothermotoga thermarum DSM 5069]
MKRRFLSFYLLMTFAFHTTIFELLMSRFSPLPTVLVWIFALILSFYVGNSFSNFSKVLWLLTLSFISSGVISYFVMMVYLREALKFAVQIVTLKMTVVSLVTIFATSCLISLVGYIFREK